MFTAGGAEAEVDEVFRRILASGSSLDEIEIACATADYGALKDCDLVIEAVVENLEEKRKVFSELDKVCGPATIFASNTSSISITAQAAATKRLDRFVGLHFMNPVPIMKLVEIVRPDGTSEATYALRGSPRGEGR